MTADTITKIDRLWLEITGKCNLECVHCYADSGPLGNHGTMTAGDWSGVIDDARKLGASVQLIGGEPTKHPQFSEILGHAIEAGIGVEVYSNLVTISAGMWELFRAPNVSLAFSYYSKDSGPHNALTRRNSHASTRSNAAKAVELGIPIRAGIIDTGGGHADGARADLADLGITTVRVDRIRGVGRAGGNDVSELCGRCGRGVAAVGPDGDVWPCVMSRWLSVGNVRMSPLPEILAGRAMARTVATIPLTGQSCDPECSPASPTGGCAPRGAIGQACDPNTECTPGSPGSECSPRT